MVMSLKRSARHRDMDTLHPIPPVIERQVPTRRLSVGKFFAEIAITGVAGMVAVVFPVLFVSHPHLPADAEYQHIAFFPLLIEASALPVSLQCLSYVLLAAVCLVLGFGGRGPIWLVGPAIMLIYPIWSFIDLLAGGDTHQLWPFEMIAYGVMSLVYIVPTGIGRLARLWWTRRYLSYDA